MKKRGQQGIKIAIYVVLGIIAVLTTLIILQSNSGFFDSEEKKPSTDKEETNVEEKTLKEVQEFIPENGDFECLIFNLNDSCYIEKSIKNVNITNRCGKEIKITNATLAFNDRVNISSITFNNQEIWSHNCAWGCSPKNLTNSPAEVNFGSRQIKLSKSGNASIKINFDEKILFGEKNLLMSFILEDSSEKTISIKNINDCPALPDSHFLNIDISSACLTNNWTLRDVKLENKGEKNILVKGIFVNWTNTQIETIGVKADGEYVWNVSCDWACSPQKKQNQLHPLLFGNRQLIVKQSSSLNIDRIEWEVNGSMINETIEVNAILSDDTFKKSEPIFAERC